MNEQLQTEGLDTLDKLVAVGEWVMIRPIDDEEKTLGGIIIPDQSKEFRRKGEILKVKSDEKSKLSIGQKVLYKMHTAAHVQTICGEKIVLAKRWDIIGIVTGEKSTDVQATRDNVFLEWEFAKDEYDGSNLLRPDNYKERHYTGLVLSVGEDVKEVVAGDRVFFDQWSSPEKFPEDNKRYAFVKEMNIFSKGLELRTQTYNELGKISIKQAIKDDENGIPVNLVDEHNTIADDVINASNGVNHG